MTQPSEPSAAQVALWCFRRILLRVLREPVSATLRWASSAAKASPLLQRVLPLQSKSTKRQKFPYAVRELCWQKAEEVPGRHPNRWRRDVAGNLAAKELHGCEGALCYTYDHIVPLSKGGGCSLDNCQILQTAANFWKGDKDRVSAEALRSNSVQLHVSERDMDAVEIALYGNVWKGEGSEKLPLYRVRKMPWPALPPK